MEDKAIVKDVEQENVSANLGEKIISDGCNTNVVTMGQWLLFWLVGLINLVPFIGTIAYLIIIAVCAFALKGKLPESLRNFCKAYLIMLVIMIVIVMVFAGSIMGAMMGMSSGF